METIVLEIPSKPEFIVTLRLATASIAQLMGFNIEVVDDLRICVSEAVNYLVDYNEKLHFEYFMEEEELRIVIQAENIVEKKESPDLHWLILDSLLDKVEKKNNSLILTKKL